MFELPICPKLFRCKKEHKDKKSTKKAKQNINTKHLKLSTGGLSEARIILEGSFLMKLVSCFSNSNSNNNNRRLN
jgi:hypothetical protein